MEVNKHYAQEAASTMPFLHFTLDITVPKNSLYSLIEEGRTDMVHQKQWWEEKVELVPETVQDVRTQDFMNSVLSLKSDGAAQQIPNVEVE